MAEVIQAGQVMAESNKRELVFKLIKEITPNKNISIKLDQKLCDDLGLCSYDMMLLISLMEENGLSVNITQIGDNATVEELVKAVDCEE